MSDACRGPNDRAERGRLGGPDLADWGRLGTPERADCGRLGFGGRDAADSRRLGTGWLCWMVMGCR